MDKRQRIVLGCLLLIMIYLIVRISGEEYARFNDKKRSELQALTNAQLEEEIAYLTQRLGESQTTTKRVYHRRVSGNMRFSNEQVFKIVENKPDSVSLDLQEAFFWWITVESDAETDASDMRTIPQKWLDLLWKNRHNS